MYSGPVSYDARGNLTAHSGKSYNYDIYNNLTSVTGTGISVSLDYDAKGRLAEENSANGIVQFAYAGSALIAEYDSSNTLLRRYVHGPGSDEPIAVYEGSGTASKFYMMADHQGSIIGYTDSAGTVTDKNSYSPEGVPDAANVGRFGYAVSRPKDGEEVLLGGTGQMWLAEAELYHYKARAYDPQLGRFLQADPIGYGDGLNMYAYVGGDAVNSRDPSGLAGCYWETTWERWRDGELIEVGVTVQPVACPGTGGGGFGRFGGGGSVDYGGVPSGGIFGHYGGSVATEEEGAEEDKEDCDNTPTRQIPNTNGTFVSSAGDSFSFTGGPRVNVVVTNPFSIPLSNDRRILTSAAVQLIGNVSYSVPGYGINNVPFTGGGIAVFTQRTISLRSPITDADGRTNFFISTSSIDRTGNTGSSAQVDVFVSEPCN